MDLLHNRKSATLREYPIIMKDSPRLEKYKEGVNQLYGENEPKDELKFFNEIFHSNVIGARNNFLLGRFYVFNYTYPHEPQGKVKRKFLDLKPLIFVLDDHYNDQTGKRYVKGINLNYLDFKSRINFLQIYFHMFYKIIDVDLWYAERGEYNIYKMKHSEIEFFYNAVTNTFPYISNAIRYWDFERVIESTVTVVRVNDYNVLFTYSGYEESVKGRHWKIIQNELIKTEKYS